MFDSLLAQGRQLLQDQLADVAVPDMQITLAGEELTALRQRLMSLTLTDNRGFEADTLTLELDDADGQLAMPPRGAELSVALGWRGEPLTHKGTFIVDELAHQGPPDRLTVSASSADFRADFNVKREYSWHDVTVEFLVQALAGRYGLTPVVSEQLLGAKIDHADQHDESDISFLTRIADMLGAVATIKNGNLLFIWPGAGLSASGLPLPAITITRADGDRHQFRIADRDAYTGVQAHWLDLSTGTKRKTTVEREKQGEYLAGQTGNVHVLRTTYRTEKAAKRAAAAKWSQLQRGAAEFQITLERGRADLYPELPATVEGFKPEIDSAGWVLTRVVHNIGGSGYTSDLELEL